MKNINQIAIGCRRFGYPILLAVVGVGIFITGFALNSWPSVRILRVVTGAGLCLLAVIFYGESRHKSKNKT